MGFCGCKKNDDGAAASSAAASQASPANPEQSNQASSPSAAAQPAGAPEAKAALADGDAALKARDYERAVADALALQRQQLTEAQSQAAAAQMVRLQRDLATAVASGDPKAKAAADALRASAAHR